MASLSERSPTFAQHSGAEGIRKQAPVFRRSIGAQIARELGRPLAEKICAARAVIDKNRFGDFEKAQEIMELHGLSAAQVDAVNLKLLAHSIRKESKEPEISSAMKGLGYKIH